MAHYILNELLVHFLKFVEAVEAPIVSCLDTQVDETKEISMDTTPKVDSDADLDQSTTMTEPKELPMAIVAGRVKYKSTLSKALPETKSQMKSIIKTLTSDGEKNLAWTRQLEMDALGLFKQFRRCILKKLKSETKWHFMKRQKLKKLSAEKAQKIMEELFRMKSIVWMKTMKHNEYNRRNNRSSVNDPYLPATGIFADAFWIAPPAWILNICLLKTCNMNTHDNLTISPPSWMFFENYDQ